MSGAIDVRVGVLALQGAFAEHLRALERLGIRATKVTAPPHLEQLDALIVPGGESTTISHLLGTSGLVEPMRARLREGLPVLGTCAGMILMASRISEGRDDQIRLSMVDIAVRRNGYGRQVFSFEADLTIPQLGSDPFRGVFIRAPLVTSAGPEVEVLAELPGPDDRSHPVLCRQGAVVVSSFHPELSGDDRLHRWFLEGVVAASAAPIAEGA